jgi:hypothetical protein
MCWSFVAIDGAIKNHYRSEISQLNTHKRKIWLNWIVAYYDTSAVVAFLLHFEMFCTMVTPINHESIRNRFFASTKTWGYKRHALALRNKTFRNSGWPNKQSHLSLPLPQDLECRNFAVISWFQLNWSNSCPTRLIENVTHWIQSRDLEVTLSASRLSRVACSLKISHGWGFMNEWHKCHFQIT